MAPPLLPGPAIASVVTNAAALGFVPVAIYFDLFAILTGIGKPASARDLVEAWDKQRRDSASNEGQLSVQLAADTLYVMAGLGFVDLVEDNVFVANCITKHLVNMPSAQHGALHFTTEALLGGALLLQKLKDTNFEYPFKEAETPFQHIFQLTGNERLARMHTYSIMEHQGRMDSFNQFMVGKFHKFGKMPCRVKGYGYNLDAVINQDHSVTIVDIAGGRGELLLEIKEEYPHLGRENLILEEFNAEVNGSTLPDLTVVVWNFKQPNSPQPVEGANIYLLQHILHNLPDLEAISLLQKLAKAMAPSSRLLIQEFPKNLSYAGMHATMICLYGGRERSPAEWRQMAALSGLEITFEAWAAQGESLLEMRKIAPTQ
ncbi:hypothetical protein ASPZODRAFT_136139 [Penicilliopsis zonata CBS 506.65]|uniref:O-methyltransferase C-terminal domain-containing protein n=1 Tax=Penicilliopsis zonata CBS 506.65 TaxID=1073090 RepID=A0A1L9S947_9EURO|nr:hypothetical protein ASPZODRAFT_136139 [Penicilliopsis zonata CBS 506.65]OJJ43678.1 hypothetical protein ASPZODRAFT_136139 [Penicilliopsis zonata CBS 506.65]